MSAPVTPPADQNPTQPQDWRADLGPDIGAHPVFSKYTGTDYVRVPRDVPKALVEAQRFIGGEKIPAPREDWTPDDYAQHWNRLGRPENLEGYELTLPEGMPEDLPRHADDERAMVEAMFAEGLSKTQAQRLYQKLFAVNGERWKAIGAQQAAAREQAVATLRKEWGAAFDAKAALAGKAFRAAAGPAWEQIQYTKLADGTPLGDHPVFVKMMATIGEKMGEHKLLGADSTGPRQILDPREATLEYAKLERELYAMEKDDLRREALVHRMNQLAQMAFGAGE